MFGSDARLHGGYLVLVRLCASPPRREYDPGRFGFKGSPRFDDLKLRSPEAAACTRLGVGERRLGSVRFVEEGRWKQQLRRRGSRRPASVASCDAAGRQEAPRRWPHPRRPSG
ncbi:unnamed protein product [Prorocentrum cordatum]|uniref:Uncharacterized protein n=1 Tax=Prorocentrum cordatum TaxID=2364126 RepID=A0ABN9WQU5_9DINO|nr:unnamed protein product [Polarella glacialis]